MSLTEFMRDQAAHMAKLAECLDEDQFHGVALALAQARQVMVYATGREAGLLHSFGAQLAKLGRPISHPYDVAPTPLCQGDIFLTSAATGATPSVSTRCRGARATGADVFYFTARPDRIPAGLATIGVIIPAADPVQDEYLPRLFFYLTALGTQIARLCEETPDRIAARKGTMR